MKHQATFTFPNSDGLPMVLTIENDPDINSFLKVSLATHGSGGAAQSGYAQVQFQANGQVIVRIHDTEDNKIKPLIV